MGLIENIFSVRNSKGSNAETFKVITILGLKFSFRNKFKELQNEVKLLRTIIENSIDISNIPKAKGNLRKVQLIKAKLLSIVDIVFKKHNLAYWLEYGTLIGAIRHNGFIPWDDDLDISMLKEDYLKVPQIIKEDLCKYGIVITLCNKNGSPIIRVGYEGFNVDIFPSEYINSRCETKEQKDEFIKKWLKVKEILFKKIPIEKHIDGKITHIDIIPDADKIKKAVIDKNYAENKNSNQIVRSVETMALVTRFGIHDVKYLFPLADSNFEGLNLPIPCDPIYYLYETDCYGEYGSVMNFPNITDDGFAHTQHKYNDTDIDFDNILAELEKIEQECTMCVQA